jgi:biotin carboxyl carrier protein
MSYNVLADLLAAVRRSGFTSGVVRVDDVHLEFGRPTASPGAGAPVAAAQAPAGPPDVPTPAGFAPAVEVRAGGPGIVHLRVQPGAPVAAGDALGHLRVHRKEVLLVAPAGGSVGEVRIPDGAFAEYGDVVCSITAGAEAPASS